MFFKQIGLYASTDALQSHRMCFYDGGLT